MVKQRNNRQDAIREIVRSKSIQTQRALVDELKLLGYSCTQATVSRDIADMGLCKQSEGSYVLLEDLHLRRMVSEFATSTEQANNLVVIKSMLGTAPGIAAAIDAASFPEVKGSIAGNDTVLVVSDSNQGASEFVQRIEQLCHWKNWPIDTQHGSLVDETGQ